MRLWVSVWKAAEYLRLLVWVISHKSCAFSIHLFFFLNFLLILCEFYIMHPKPTYFSVPCLCNTPHKEKNKNEKTKQSKQNKNSLQWKLQCVIVSHSTASVQTSFQANVHCHELLVWFEASVIHLFQDSISNS